MAAVTNWSLLPLPVGWQAVWDQTQNRYFFIDHTTQSTTWIDPREEIWRQQNMAAQSKQHWSHELKTMTRAGSISALEEYEIEETMFMPGSSTPDRHMSTGSRTRTESTGSHHGYSDAHKQHLLTKLKAEFPETTEEFISDFIELNHGNEKETRKVLKELGCKHRPSASSRTQSPPGGRGPSHSSSQSPRRRSTPKALSPARIQSVPAPVQLTTMEKNNLMRKLQQEFEAVSHTVVEMALEVSMYDEAKARAVLNTQARPSTTTGTASNGVSQSRRSSTQQGDRRDVSHSRSATPSYPSATPTPLGGSGLIETTVHAESGPVRSPTPVGVISSSSSGSVTPRGASTTPRAKSPAKKTKQPAQKASATAARPTPKSTVTSSRPAPKSSVTSSRLARADMQKKSTTVPKQSEYMSPNRTLAKGPDPSLVMGPQTQNLIRDYIRTQGTDGSLVEGPNSDNHKGPSVTTVGPNTDLARGPQRTCAMDVVRRNACERVFEMLCLKRETAL